MLVLIFLTFYIRSLDELKEEELREKWMVMREEKFHREDPFKTETDS